MGAPSRASGEQVHQARLARGEPDHRFLWSHAVFRGARSASLELSDGLGPF